MLSFAAIALAAASAATTPPTSLMSNSPWWEKITYIYDDNGSHRSCAYESNLATDPAEACDVANAPKKEAGGSGVLTKITFERRFTPGAPPETEKLQPGDKLLGGLMMMVAFDENGAVRGCSVVAETGDAKPEYGCEQVRAEKFQASATVGAQASKHGFLTVIVYGHEEELV